MQWSPTFSTAYPNNLTMCRYRDDWFSLVLAPDGEILSFASPKESIQRRGDPVAAYFLRSSLSMRVAKGAPAPSSTCGIPVAPLTGYSRRKLRYSARHTGLNPPCHRQIYAGSQQAGHSSLYTNILKRVIPAGIAGIQKPWMADTETDSSVGWVERSETHSTPLRAFVVN